MDINQALGQIRPLLSIAGSIIIAAGVLKFFGVQVPISGGAVEIAAIGWLIKGI